MVTRDEWAAANGVVSAGNQHCCLRRLEAGGRCNYRRCDSGWNTLDHGTVWRRPGERIPCCIVGQPYQLLDDQRAWLERLRRGGFHIVVAEERGAAWHNEACVRVEIWRR
jgi:hypothetical protein